MGYISFLSSLLAWGLGVWRITPVSWWTKSLFSYMDQAVVQSIVRVTDLSIEQLRFKDKSGIQILNDLKYEQLSHISDRVVGFLTSSELFSKSADGVYIFNSVPACGLTNTQLSFKAVNEGVSGSLLSNLSKNQLGQLNSNAVKALTSEELFLNRSDGGLVVEFLAGNAFSYQQVSYTNGSSKISGTVLEHLSSEQIYLLDVNVSSQLNADQLTLKNKSGSNILNDININSLLLSQLRYSYADGSTALSRLPSWQLSSLNTQFVTKLTSDELFFQLGTQKLTCLNAVGFTNAQLESVDGQGNTLLSLISNEQLEKLSSQTVSGLTAEQVKLMNKVRLSHLDSSKLTTEQFNYICVDGRSVLNCLTKSQIVNIDAKTLTSSQVKSLTDDQVSELTENQFSNLTESKFKDLNASGLLYEQLAYGAYNLRSVLSALTKDQIGQLSPSIIRQLGKHELKNIISSNQASGLKASQLAVFSEDQIQYLDVSKMVAAQINYRGRSGATILAQLTESQIARLSIDVVINLTNNQLRGMTGRQHAGFDQSQMVVFSATQLESLKVEMLSIEQLNFFTKSGSTLLTVLNKNQISQLTALTISKMSDAEFAQLSKSQIQSLKISDPVYGYAALAAKQFGYENSNGNFVIVKGADGYSVISQLSFDQIRSLSANEIGNLAPKILHELTIDQVAALTKEQFAKLSSKQITFLNAAGLTQAQLNYTSIDGVKVINNLNENQILQIKNWSKLDVNGLSEEAVSQICAAQFASMTEQQIQSLNVTGLTYDQLSYLSSSGNAILNILNLSQLSQINSEVVKLLNESQVCQLSREKIQRLNISEFSLDQILYKSLSAKPVLQDITIDQIKVLSDVVIKGLTNEDILLFGVDQLDIAYAKIKSLRGADDTSWIKSLIGLKNEFVKKFGQDNVKILNSTLQSLIANASNLEVENLLGDLSYLIQSNSFQSIEIFANAVQDGAITLPFGVDKLGHSAADIFSNFIEKSSIGEASQSQFNKSDQIHANAIFNRLFQKYGLSEVSKVIKLSDSLSAMLGGEKSPFFLKIILQTLEQSKVEPSVVLTDFMKTLEASGGGDYLSIAKKFEIDQWIEKNYQNLDDFDPLEKIVLFANISPLSTNKQTQIINFIKTDLKDIKFSTVFADEKSVSNIADFLSQSESLSVTGRYLFRRGLLARDIASFLQIDAFYLETKIQNLFIKNESGRLRQSLIDSLGANENGESITDYRSLKSTYENYIETLDSEEAGNANFLHGNRDAIHFLKSKASDIFSYDENTGESTLGWMSIDQIIETAISSTAKNYASFALQDSKEKAYYDYLEKVKKQSVSLRYLTTMIAGFGKASSKISDAINSNSLTNQITLSIEAAAFILHGLNGPLTAYFDFAADNYLKTGKWNMQEGFLETLVQSQKKVFKDTGANLSGYYTPLNRFNSSENLLLENLKNSFSTNEMNVRLSDNRFKNSIEKRAGNIKLKRSLLVEGGRLVQIGLSLYDIGKEYNKSDSDPLDITNGALGIAVRATNVLGVLTEIRGYAKASALLGLTGDIFSLMRSTLAFAILAQKDELNKDFIKSGGLDALIQIVLEAGSAAIALACPPAGLAAEVMASLMPNVASILNAQDLKKAIDSLNSKSLYKAAELVQLAYSSAIVSSIPIVNQFSGIANTVNGQNARMKWRDSSYIDALAVEQADYEVTLVTSLLIKNASGPFEAELQDMLIKKKQGIELQELPKALQDILSKLRGGAEVSQNLSAGLHYQKNLKFNANDYGLDEDKFSSNDEKTKTRTVYGYKLLTATLDHEIEFKNVSENDSTRDVFQLNNDINILEFYTSDTFKSAKNIRQIFYVLGEFSGVNLLIEKNDSSLTDLIFLPSNYVGRLLETQLSSSIDNPKTSIAVTRGSAICSFYGEENNFINLNVFTGNVTILGNAFLNYITGGAGKITYRSNGGVDGGLVSGDHNVFSLGLYSNFFFDGKSNYVAIDLANKKASSAAENDFVYVNSKESILKSSILIFNEMLSDGENTISFETTAVSIGNVLDVDVDLNSLSAALASWDGTKPQRTSNTFSAENMATLVLSSGSDDFTYKNSKLTNLAIEDYNQIVSKLQSIYFSTGSDFCEIFDAIEMDLNFQSNKSAKEVDHVILKDSKRIHLESQDSIDIQVSNSVEMILSLAGVSSVKVDDLPDASFTNSSFDQIFYTEGKHYLNLSHSSANIYIYDDVRSLLVEREAGGASADNLFIDSLLNLSFGVATDNGKKYAKFFDGNREISYQIKSDTEYSETLGDTYIQFWDGRKTSLDNILSTYNVKFKSEDFTSMWDLYVEVVRGSREYDVHSLDVTDEFTTVSESACAIFGGDQANQIYGGGGNDLIYGEGGDDLIYGGGGSDFVSGGGGADRFVFDNQSGHYEIMDFNNAEGDIIDLNGFKSSDFGQAYNYYGSGNFTKTGLYYDKLAQTLCLFDSSAPNDYRALIKFNGNVESINSDALYGVSSMENQR